MRDTWIWQNIDVLYTIVFFAVGACIVIEMGHQIYLNIKQWRNKK